MEFLRSYQVRFPRGVHFGLGVSEKAGEIAKGYEAKRVLIVTDRVLGPTGIIEKISQALSRTGLQPAVYDGVVTEPTTQQVQEGLEVYKKEGCDLIIALGGGSCIDAAKGIAVLATNGGRLQDYEGRGKIRKPKAPLVAIPTTGKSNSSSIAH
jgi:alcohol dehydrogenase class IV